jgi:hypothetical protein
VCIFGIYIGKQRGDAWMQNLFYWLIFAIVITYVTLSVIWGAHLNMAGFGSIKSVMDTKEGTQTDLLPDEELGWKGPTEAVCGMHLIYPADLGSEWQSVTATTPLGVDLVHDKADDPTDRDSADGLAASATSNTIFEDTTATFGTLSNALACIGLDPADPTKSKACPGATDSLAHTEGDKFDKNSVSPETFRAWKGGNLNNLKAENLRVKTNGLRHVCTAEEYNGLGPPEKACGDFDEQITENQSIRFYTYGPLTLFWSMLVVHFIMLFIAPCAYHAVMKTPKASSQALGGTQWYMQRRGMQG